MADARSVLICLSYSLEISLATVLHNVIQMPGRPVQLVKNARFLFLKKKSLALFLTVKNGIYLLVMESSRLFTYIIFRKAFDSVRRDLLYKALLKLVLRVNYLKPYNVLTASIRLVLVLLLSAPLGCDKAAV